MPEVDANMEAEGRLGLERPSWNSKPALRLTLDRVVRIADDESELEAALGLRWTPPEGTVGKVDNNGLGGKEEGKTARGADDSGFFSI